MWTIHPWFSVYQVNHELSPRPARLLLYAGTIAIQALIAALYLKFGVKTPPDVEYSAAGPAAGAAILLSLPLNYGLAWVYRHFMPNGVERKQTQLKMFDKVMVAGITCALLGTVGVGYILSMQGGITWIASAFAAIFIDSLLDLLAVKLSQHFERAFRLCRLRGFYVEDLVNDNHAKRRRTVRRNSKRPSLIPKDAEDTPKRGKGTQSFHTAVSSKGEAQDKL
jgi:hypothetical protein